MIGVAILIVAALCVGAWVYVRRARHPQSRQLAAYLIFLTVFSALAVAGYVMVGIVLTALDSPALVENPLFGLALLAVTLVPAFLVARRQIRHPALADDRYDRI